MRLQLGSPVLCTDGPYGDLGDVIIEPHGRRVTHLVVEPHHRHELARLVPVELVIVERSEEAPSRPALALRCTTEEVHRMASVQNSGYVGLSELLPGEADSDIGVQDVSPLPSDGSTGLGEYPGLDDPHVWITYDSVPKGQIEIRSTSAVTSADGHHLGHVHAVVLDGDDQVREFVLERGHLWGKREVTIPIGAVATVETDSVTLNLTKADARALRGRLG